MKRVLFVCGLLAALIPFAVGQDNNRLPQASLDREVDIQAPVRAAVLGKTSHYAPGPPKYCKPCLFYAGDFDSNASDANGLADEFDVIVSTGAAVYVPFRVPKGKTWTVTGLFVNTFLSAYVLDPAKSPYEVRTGIPATGGNGGKLVCQGTLPSVLKVTGGTGYGQILGIFVRGIKGCRLKGGVKYWQSVVPYCTNPNDSFCKNSWRAFELNDDGPMANRFGGIEPANNSFFNSVFFGSNWEPSSNFQSSTRFSMGVEGTSK